MSKGKDESGCADAQQSVMGFSEWMRKEGKMVKDE